MRLDIKTTAITFGLIWGMGAILMTGLANLIWPGYGQAFLDVVSSIYPGYHATASLGQVVAGALYGSLDGLIAGAVFAWLYNFVGARVQSNSS
tara:strand:- start:77 stop:355 length:279 start_codon:yes stop_codon:yes gene_type:complete